MRRAVYIQQWRSHTVWMLVLSILLQPVVAYLATPSVAQDQRGHYVLLCTLQGLQEVYVKHDQVAADAGDEEYCPALKLFELISSAETVASFQAPDPRRYAVSSSVVRLDDPVTLSKPSIYPIRAPPLS